ncbi:MAG: D-glycero-beta-D-manno-heptose 1,7-bisphosphate 7-phosphatase [Caldilinea sp.]|uniref:D-glycero-beta-D-manno-heptose 1,7-bisphosphate 7-phosphatase n=1 Tax=Caldilinea sp. TaxID=2293560 RepID=UPI002BBDEB86|nr:D-glycero-beta-D-manno-heptose 1,7-bisphosphate 7-phosphatase [Anaerolineales bacterium]HQY93121.1 D-glycero-beta-D-manno-heptose 1,7-bisphosphate 7-phosphatase [Caldilinea sp.]HRA68885.1 D-glycero-beta-D-manno-heptose 1,7-bisphosphate 7-phosphatase [Caldilinea sp.]
MIDAIFLDRDGTINAERSDYVKSNREFVLLPGALEALGRLATLTVPIIIVTNQSAIGRGIVSRIEIDAIHDTMRSLVRAAGGRIDAVYLCPHHPEARCICRKPKPGLLLAAAADYQIDLTRCVLIGDSVTDLEAARAVGCQPLMVRTGRQAQALARLAEVDETVVLVDDLTEAVDLLCARLTAGVNVCEAK